MLDVSDFKSLASDVAFGPNCSGAAAFECCLYALMRGLELFWSIVTGADSCFGRQTSRIRSLVANTRSKKL